MGSSNGIKEALEKLTAMLDKMQATQESMQVSLDKLAPLAPLADQLAAIPAKVTSLQALAYEKADQVCALNLAVIRAEKALRRDKSVADEDGDPSNRSVGNPPKSGAPPDKQRPPPEQFVDRRGTGDGHHNNHRFHPRFRLEFPCVDGKEDRSHG
jgi:hypothetical protein